MKRALINCKYIIYMRIHIVTCTCDILAFIYDIWIFETGMLSLDILAALAPGQLIPGHSYIFIYHLYLDI